MTMLDRMRRHKGLLKWSLIAVAVTFVLFYIPDFLGTTDMSGNVVLRGAVAKVGTREIPSEEFRQRYLLQIQAYQQAYGDALTDDMLRQMRVETQILEQMIDERLQLSEADRLGLTVTDGEVRARILSMAALQENGQFIGEARYRQLLAVQRPPVTPAQFEEQIRDALLLEKLGATLTAWVSVSPDELEREYRQRNERVRLDLVTLPFDVFSGEVTAPDEEIEARYTENPEAYRVEEKRKIRYALLDLAAIREQVTPTDAEIALEYERRLPDYTTPEEIRASHILLRTEGKDAAEVRGHAEEVLAQARAGADFAELARDHSDDDSNREQGGDLDWFGRGQMVPEFDEAAFQLEEPGQISDLVESPFGFHIIRLTEKRPAQVRPLEGVREEIVAALTETAAQQRLAQQTQRFIDGVDEVTDLDTIAAAVGVTVQESGFFGVDDLVPGLGLAPAAAARAFDMADDEVSGAVAVPQGEVFFVLNGREDAYVPELDEVREVVRLDVIRDKAKVVAEERAAALGETLQAASDFAAATETAGFSVQTTDLVPRDSVLPTVGISPAVDRAAFSLPVGEVSDPIATDTAYVILRVAERPEMTGEEFEEAKDDFRDQLLSDRRNRFYASYMRRVRDDSDIVVDEDVLHANIDENLHIH